MDPKNYNQEAHTRLGQIRDSAPPLPRHPGDRTFFNLRSINIQFINSYRVKKKKKKENSMIKPNFVTRENILELNLFFWQCNKPRGLII